MNREVSKKYYLSLTFEKESGFRIHNSPELKPFENLKNHRNSSGTHCKSAKIYQKATKTVNF